MNKNNNIYTMKTFKTKSVKIAVVLGLLLVLYSNFSFGQWIPSGTSNLANLGSWPSTCVVNSSIVFVVGGTSTNGPIIYRSTNGGQNFSALSRNGLNTSTTRFLSCVWAKNKDTIFVGEGSPSGNGLTKNVKFYRTYNGGNSWTSIASSGNNITGFFNGIVFSKSNPQFGIAHCDPDGTSGNFLVWKTTNGGKDWTKMTISQSQNAYGAQNSVFVIDQNFFGFGLSESNARVGITTNGGTNWTYSSLPGADTTQGFVSTVTFNEDKLHGYTGVSSTQDSLWKTTNGGLNWVKFGITGLPNTVSGQANVKYVYGTQSAFYVVSNSLTSYTYKLIDFGANIVSIGETPSMKNIMHLDLNYTQVLDAPGDAVLYAVSNTGNIFTMQDSPLPVTLASFSYAVSGRNVNLKWITSSEQNNSGFEVWRIFGDANRNITSNWTNIGFIQGKGTVNGNTEYNFTDKNLSTGKYYYRIKQIDYNGNYEYFDLNGSADIGAPSKVSLGQNYPNPFNPVTNIGYEIPQDARVTMKVYDIAGREISTLVNETQAAGYHTVKFDASKYSSGMYFYKVVVKSANGTVSEYTKTMSVVK